MALPPTQIVGVEGLETIVMLLPTDAKTADLALETQVPLFAPT